ncbi:hypothetical protein CDQ71_00255 [Campylobacter hyointestinalis subsp. hyointestinalis]|uniref:hypothetical protein n=1 Tax=Campylobacter hyointestinalis TaxID=198 RepID=UPI000CE3E427|nr:hypothetical protein [Campylobacter hyointestinalis]PPB58763.1 hypothetical protein CDQ71_00255 [Campylobacter hyointestinalis subsp. hyointestinalis]PPB65685.1 hypothetical protein CDQ75_08830 [Campylobacter hyointestinalis subsp. hyointestinalis]
MSIYIKINGDIVELGGTVINEAMIKDGFFEYNGIVPEIDYKTQRLVYEDGTLKAIDKETTNEKIAKITLRQTKLILNQMGLLSGVESYINSIEDEKLRATAKIEWEYANDVERTNPLITTLQTGLNLSDEQVDTMFEQASKL